MRLTFLVNYDLAALLALNHLLPSCKQHDVSVFHTRKTPAPNEFSFQSAKQLKAQPKTHPTALQSLAAFEAKVLAESTRLASFSDLGAIELNDINGADFQTFTASAPDLVISIRHMSILKPPVIEVPKFAVINLHSGLLPAYQGVMSTFRAMANGDANLGTTLHFIEDSSIDSGSIIARSQTSARYDKSYLWNVLNLYRNGCTNVLTAIDSIANGEALKAKLQEGEAEYFTYPSDDEINAAPFRLFEDNESLPGYHS
ncbi:formyl transferase [Pseudomonadales bacterium]|nr:formyl transferase [Pseudomonadales bacterium]